MPMTYQQRVRHVATAVQSRICLLLDSDGVNPVAPSLCDTIESVTNGECMRYSGCSSHQFRLDVECEVMARWGIGE